MSAEPSVPGFSRWESNEAYSKVAVDRDGRRWYKTGSDTYSLVPHYQLAGDARQQHLKALSADADTTANGGPTMATPTSSTTPGEVTGIRSAVAHLEAVAKAHASHAGDEGFIGSLVRMEVGADDQQRTRAAQEQSRNAARLWADAAASVRANNMPVAEAYSASPGAGNKQAQTNE